jgi:hypothetical protein
MVVGTQATEKAVLKMAGPRSFPWRKFVLSIFKGMVLGTVACFVFGLVVTGFLLFLPGLPTDKDTVSKYPEVAHFGNADPLTRLRLLLGIQGSIRSLGQEVKELPKGDIVLDAPSVMKVGETRRVDAHIGYNVPAGILRKKKRGDDQQITGQASLSSDMVATLDGSEFRISRITPEEQPIAEGAETVWSWDVTANNAGEKELEIVLYALLPLNDKILRVRVNSYSQTITVEVRQKTLDEWLRAISDDVGQVKGIVLAIVGAGTAVLGWFGLNHTRGRATALKKKLATREKESG